MGRYAIPLVVFLVVAAFLGIGLTLDPKEVPSPFVGKAAPSINLPDLRDGGKTVKTEDLKGRPWLLNVWATWCPECWREHGFLVRLAREKGITIVGLNWKDEPGKARDMLRKLGDPYALIADDQKGRVAIDWGVYGAPETFLVDANGIIQAKLVGALNEASWKEQLEPQWKAAVSAQ